MNLEKQFPIKQYIKDLTPGYCSYDKKYGLPALIMGPQCFSPRVKGGKRKRIFVMPFSTVLKSADRDIEEDYNLTPIEPVPMTKKQSLDYRRNHFYGKKCVE